MRPANVFQLEVASAVSDRRRLAMRLALPLLLALPFVLAVMPPRVRAAGLVLLTLFIGLFGAAVATVRRRAEGRVAYLRVLPIPRWLAGLDFLLAGSAVDLAQLGGVLVLFLAVNAKGLAAADVAALAGCLVVTVVLLNGAGMALASVLRSSPEVHLLGALAVGVVAFLSGVFPVPGRLGRLIESIGPWDPVAALARLLTAIAEDGPAATGAGWAAAGGAVVAVTAACLAWRGFDLGRRAAARRDGAE